MSRHQNIPKIIHQIWIGPNPCPVQWMDTWKTNHPDWEYRLWTEENLPKLRNQQQFDAIKSYSGKADILRIEILYDYGGIYLDADSECLHSLDDSLLRYHFFACYENEKIRPGTIANGTIGCEKGHPIMLELINAVHNITEIGSMPAWAEVGPLLFTKIIKEYEVYHGYVAILPSHAFYPDHYAGVHYSGHGKVYAKQHWQTTHDELD